MELLADIFIDATMDTLKLVPFLFVCYLLMEFIEHKAGDRAAAAIRNTRAAGPFVGALLGAFPQCGFSAAAATLYAGRVITIGTLIAVFLATSDEMLPIFIAEQVDARIILEVLGCKVAIGMIMGFVIDLVLRLTHRDPHPHLHIHELCEQDGCDCDCDNCELALEAKASQEAGHDHGHSHDHDHDGHHHHGSIAGSALHHTLRVTVFIFLITLVLNGAIELIGEEAFGAFIAANPALSIVASGIVGLIPNCAASVVITELYLDGVLGTGALMSGLLVSAGIGLLVLLRTNRNWRETLDIVLLLFVCGIIWGFIFQATGVVFA